MKHNNYNKNIFNKKLILPSITLCMFIIWSILVFTRAINPLDELVESFVIGLRNDNLTKIMINITNLGGAYSLIVISILLFFFIKNKKVPLSIIINLVTVFFTSQLFKFIFRRSRPNGVFLADATGYSYPSGHTMVSFAFYIYLLYLLCKRINNKLVKILLTIFTTFLLLLIAFSRIYLGVHYLSDIIGGVLLGTTYIILFIRFNNSEVKQ